MFKLIVHPVDRREAEYAEVHVPAKDAEAAVVALRSRLGILTDRVEITGPFEVTMIDPDRFMKKNMSVHGADERGAGFGLLLLGAAVAITLMGFGVWKIV